MVEFKGLREKGGRQVGGKREKGSDGINLGDDGESRDFYVTH